MLTHEIQVNETK